MHGFPTIPKVPNGASNRNAIVRKQITVKYMFLQLHVPYTLLVAIGILKFVETGTSWAGNLFRARAEWDFPEQLVGRSDKRKPQNEDITICLLQSRQISEMAGAGCHEEVCQWMSSTTEECHWDGGPRAGSEGETSCTSFWRRAVRNSRCQQTWLRCVEQ